MEFPNPTNANLLGVNGEPAGSVSAHGPPGNALGMSMSIDLTEPIAAGHHLGDAARRRTSDGVDAIRDVDLHLPVVAEAVMAAASHRVRRARKHAKHAARDTRRSVETTVDHGSRRVRRRAVRLSNQSTKPSVRVWVIAAVLLGGATAIGALAMKRQRSQPAPAFPPSSESGVTASAANGSAPANLAADEVTLAP